MVLHGAPGVLAALSLTRILTFLSDACQVIRTIRIQNTFWPTGRWGALVARQAGAGGTTVLLTAFRVRPARAGLARILITWWFS